MLEAVPRPGPVLVNSESMLMRGLVFDAPERQRLRTAWNSEGHGQGRLRSTNNDSKLVVSA
jgi:hypothetical protein